MIGKAMDHSGCGVSPLKHCKAWVGLDKVWTSWFQSDQTCPICMSIDAHKTQTTNVCCAVAQHATKVFHVNDVQKVWRTSLVQVGYGG